MNTNHIYFFLSLALYPGTFSLLTGFDPKHLPRQSDPQGHQTGYNQCGTTARPDSKCQNLFIYSAENFCFFAPATQMPVGTAERDVVAYCSKDGYGTRLIPPNTFKSLHYIRTPHYVQITGLGDFTKVNVPPKDEGGEMDPSGADGHGNPAGGLVFGEKGQFDRWTEFLAYDEFSLRACFNSDVAYKYCEHIYDLEGSRWNMPGDYDTPTFDQCEADDVPLPMGYYRRPDGSVYQWHRGSSPQPPPGAPGRVHRETCKTVRPPGATYSRSARRAPPS